MSRKRIVLRYPPEFEKCLYGLKGLVYYGQSENMGIIHAVQIASAFVKELKEGCPEKKYYNLINKVEASLNIKLQPEY